MTWLNFITLIVAIIVSLPLLIISVELLITLFHKPLINANKEDDTVKFQGSYKILMPAHNEAEMIAKTLTGLLQQNISVDSIIVVADNCTDATAEIANNLSVTVLERFNTEQRGKGFALDHGIAYLKTQQPPDVMIVLDADCEINAESLNLLANQCQTTATPTQALYLMRHNLQGSLKQKVAGFAWLVKNKIRPIAVNKLGLPVTLTGTGMAFPWQVIEHINVADGNIVEDMQLGIDCTLNGYAPKFCEQAVVYSDFPEQQQAEKTQRTRWEHGHLMTIVQQVPRLIKRAIVNKEWRLLGLALDLSVPPLALLVTLSLINLLFFIAVSLISENSYAFLLMLTCFLLFTFMLISTWWRFGRDYLTLKELAGIPVYILSKLSIYLKFIDKPQQSWVRTERDFKDSE